MTSIMNYRSFYLEFITVVNFTTGTDNELDIMDVT